MFRPILLVALVAATLFAFTGNTGESEASAPGGNGLIAFVRSGDIWTIDPVTLAENQLTNIGGVTGGVDWSPQGDRIAFGRGNDIYIINQDGSNLVQLTATADEEQNPSWSPDGTAIAYGRGPVGGPFDVYRSGDDGSNLTQLTNDPAWDLHPAWSPVASDIVFTSVRTGSAELWVMDAVTGAGQTQLTFSGGVLPDYSPDGQQITFYRGAGVNADVFTMDAGGGNEVQRTFVVGEDLLSKWSPDGTQIAFHSTRSGFDVLTMNANGTAQTILTNGGGAGLDWQAVQPPDPAGVGGVVELAVVGSSDSPQTAPAGGVSAWLVAAAAAGLATLGGGAFWYRHVQRRRVG